MPPHLLFIFETSPQSPDEPSFSLLILVKEQQAAAWAEAALVPCPSNPGWCQRAPEAEQTRGGGTSGTKQTVSPVGVTGVEKAKGSGRCYFQEQMSGQLSP